MKGKIASWVFILIAITCLILEPTCEAADPTLDLTNPSKTDYANRLAGLRTAVADPKLKYGGTNLPVVAAPTTPANYYYIDIRADSGTVKIGFSKNDIYVLGYQANVDGTKKAHFFSDVAAHAKTNAFPEVSEGAKNRINMTFTGAYRDLPARNKQALGVSTLKKFINQLYQNRGLTESNEKSFMLIVIQMLAEATRFKYLQDKLEVNFGTGLFTPETKTMALEDNWAKSTKAIKGSKNGKINPPFELKYGTTVVQTYSEVSKLAAEMALLKYEGK